MTLLRLLLIFPAYFLGIYCAAWWDSHKRVYYLHDAAIADVRQVYLQLAFIEERFGRDAVPRFVIDQWLDNSLPAKHPAWRVLADRQELDPWGNPYRCTENPARKGKSLGALGVFSTGRDGISRSKGNDPDDLNSWDEKPGAYYRSEIRSEERKRYAVQGLFVAPVVYAVLIAIGFTIRWLFGYRLIVRLAGDDSTPLLAKRE